MNERVKEVTFINQKLKDSYDSLQKGKFEDKGLYKFITRAKTDLLSDPICGIHVSNRLIPKEYIRKYEVTNLWKYDLPNGWRILYTIIGNEIKIVCVILEWLSHKDYERKFNY